MYVALKWTGNAKVWAAIGSAESLHLYRFFASIKNIIFPKVVNLILRKTDKEKL